jgi:hypothetical protein
LNSNEEQKDVNQHNDKNDDLQQENVERNARIDIVKAENGRFRY